MSKTTWNFPNTASRIAAKATANTFGLGDPLVAQLLTRRGLVGEALALYLNPDLKRLESPAGMRNIDAAAKILDEAIRVGRKITIYGDYDVDGTTSTALLLSYLRSKGSDASFYIPQRSEGYGLTQESADKILREQKPELLITVDCGTSSREVVNYIRTFKVKHPVEVIVTDHHQPSPGKLVNGVVVNPHLDPTATNKGLAGVGVIYKLVAHHYGSQPKGNLDLVAMGTVADVMPLLDVTQRDIHTGEITIIPANENRILVRAGLDRLAHTRRIGLAALVATAIKPIKCIHGATVCVICGEMCSHDEPLCYAPTAEDVGYQIGPRINAISRMGLDPALVVELLTTDDASRAKEIAKLLDETNKERRKLTNELVDQAMEQVDPEQPVIVLQMDLFKGVAGLVAGRLANEFGRPAIVVDQSGSGSARSVAGISLLDVLQQDLSAYAKADGHQMAMGISRVHDVDLLREKLNAYPWPEGFGKELSIDAVCRLADLNLELIEALRLLEPTGAANPTPLFAVGGVTITGRRFMGAESRHVKLTLQDGEGITRTAIWFGGGSKAPAEGTVVDIAGKPILNTFRPRYNIDGEPFGTVEIQIVEMRAAAENLPLTLV